jgi:hypothetical protein
MSIILELLRSLALLSSLHEMVTEPRAAARLAAQVEGDPHLAEPLLQICHRESRCKPTVGVHAIDHHLSSRGYRGQVALGHLRPWCQPYQEGAWATRGAWGLSAASHWEYLPPCYPPWVLDIALVSALVAARKYSRRCPGISWCG